MDKITRLFTTVICNEFLPLVARKTGAELSVLMKYWDEFNKDDHIPAVELPTVAPATRVQHAPAQRKVYSAAELNKLKIKDLKVICDEMKISKSGVKQQIIDKILDKCGVRDNVEPVSEVVYKKKVGKKSVSDGEEEETKKKAFKKVSETSINDDEKIESPKKLNLEKLRAPDVKITQNENGHWIHEETKIVFTSDEEYIDGMRCRLAIGYEDEDGTVEDLTSDMIEKCNQYGFRYREPINIII